MKSASLLHRSAVLAYGIACYSMFLGVFLYAVGFIGNFGVPTTLDSAPHSSLTAALLVNGALLLLFAVQHSGMARPAFKRWWTRIVAQPMERSTYVLFSNLALVGVFWLWQPMGGVVWHVESEAGRALMYGLFAAGWLVVLYATFLINHFDLFGLRQVWLYFRGIEYTSLKFNEPGMYRLVRHPLYVGWITLAWAAPTMTVSHLLFAVGVTAYILIAINFEEHDLIAAHGDSYADYRRRTPMLVPSFRRPRVSIMQIPGVPQARVDGAAAAMQSEFAATQPSAKDRILGGIRHRDLGRSHSDDELTIFALPQHLANRT